MIYKQLHGQIHSLSILIIYKQLYAHIYLYLILIIYTKLDVSK